MLAITFTFIGLVGLLLGVAIIAFAGGYWVCTNYPPTSLINKVKDKVNNF